MGTKALICANRVHVGYLQTCIIKALENCWEDKMPFWELEKALLHLEGMGLTSLPVKRRGMRKTGGPRLSHL